MSRFKRFKMNADDEEDESEFSRERAKNVELRNQMFKDLGLIETKCELENLMRRPKKNKIRPEITARPKSERLRRQTVLVEKIITKEPDKINDVKEVNLTKEIKFDTILKENDTDLNSIIGLSMDFFIEKKLKLKTAFPTALITFEYLLSKLKLTEDKTLEMNNLITSAVFHDSEEPIIIATGDNHGNITISNYNDLKICNFNQVHTDEITSIIFSKYHPEIMFTSSLDGTIRRCNFTTKQFTLSYGKNDSLPINYLYERTENTVLAAAVGGKIIKVDAREPPHCQKFFICHTNTIKTVCVNASNQPIYMVTCSYDNTISMWDFRYMSNIKRNRIWSISTETPVNNAILSRNGYRMITTYNNGRIMIYETFEQQKPICVWDVRRNINRRLFLPIKAMFHPLREDVFCVPNEINGIDIYKCDDTFVPLYSKRNSIHFNTNNVCNLSIFHPILPTFAGICNNQIYIFK